MFTSRHCQRQLRLGAFLSLTVLGCASPSAPAPVTRSSPVLNEISTAEVEAARQRYATAYDIIRGVRPSMLHSRGIPTVAQSSNSPWPSSGGIMVYVDGMRFGSLESLAQISANSVLNVRRLSSTDATLRYGTGHIEGIILVTTIGHERR